MLVTILMLIVVVLLVLGAFDRKLGGAHAGWLGLALWAFVLLIPAARALGT